MGNSQSVRKGQTWHILALCTAMTVPCLASNRAFADDWIAQGQFGWLAIGKSVEIEKGHFYWVGEFSGTFFNDKGDGSLFHKAGIKCPGFNDFDFNAKTVKGGGYCVVTDANGDQASMSWGVAGDTDTMRGTGTAVYTGGTGKYKGIGGKFPFVSVTQVKWPDGTASGHTLWAR